MLSKSLQSRFPPCSDNLLERQQVILNMSTCLSVFGCCNVIGLLLKTAAIMHQMSYLMKR